MASMLRLRQSQTLHGLERPVLPWLGTGWRSCWRFGLYLGFAAPPDYQQGDTVKIMFVHVPAAWAAMMAYGLMALSSPSR